ncbi:MAG: PH domain-containing protein [Elusimicrobia bacterium]|nr:PH domain-containing protein [Elusimicrobiota bacterium]
MQKYYGAVMDRTLRLTTRVVWLALAIPPAAMTMHWYLARSRPETAPSVWLILSVVFFMWAIAFFTRGLAPRGFALNDIELVIDRAMRPIRIPLSSVTEVRRVADAEMKGTLRTMGASGFYAHYGWFWNRALGKFRLYACRFDALVLVRAGTAVFVLGPEDPESFEADVRALTRR